MLGSFSSETENNTFFQKWASSECARVRSLCTSLVSPLEYVWGESEFRCTQYLVVRICIDKLYARVRHYEETHL